MLTIEGVNTEAPALIAEHELVLAGLPGLARDRTTMKTRLMACG